MCDILDYSVLTGFSEGGLNSLSDVPHSQTPTLPNQSSAEKSTLGKSHSIPLRKLLNKALLRIFLNICSEFVQKYMEILGTSIISIHIKFNSKYFREKIKNQVGRDV